ncbi:MAG: hypothetical protein M0T70_18115 [Geobacteraceae bacterium]|nr:hypothetical protein [Geobacteraceae bacterium]
MKRTCRILVTTVVCSVLLGCASVYADEAASNGPSEQQTRQKNECLLRSKDCGRSARSIQDKIELLNEEIAKGRAVYTPEELKVLQQKLDDVNRTLDFLLEKK